MRLLAIGDIHGCLTALDTLLEVVAPKPEDLLITLGDYVDRGPNVSGVIDRLIHLHQSGRLIPLRGNHEEMMLEARLGYHEKIWQFHGGINTLQSYGIDSSDPVDYAKIPEEHWNFIETTCRDYHEGDHHFFVHANSYPEVPLDQQPVMMLLWEKLLPVEREIHCSGKIMVCGHTFLGQSVPLNLGTAICIDTGVYDKSGWLTCLDVATGEYWQANQAGQSRRRQLEPSIFSQKK